MNIIGTHDTESALTVFGKGSSDVCWDTGSELAVRRLDEKALALAEKRMMLAASIQYTVYGVPSLYYGDEAGVEGYHDPFCRLPYPWGRENEALLKHYMALGKIREENKSVLGSGEFKMLEAQDGVVAYSRYNDDDEIIVIANANRIKKEFVLEGEWYNLLTNRPYTCMVAPLGCVILKKRLEV